MIISDDDFNIKVDDEADIFELAQIPVYDENLYSQYSSYKNGKLYNQDNKLISELYHDFIKSNYNLKKSYKYRENGDLSEIISKDIYSLMLGSTREVFKNNTESVRYVYLDEIEENEEDDVIECKSFYNNGKLLKKEEKSESLGKITIYEYKYDTSGKLLNIRIKEDNNDTENTSYEYDDKGNVIKIIQDELFGLREIRFLYDNGRIMQREVINNDANTKDISEYQYYTNSVMKQCLSISYENNQLTSKHYIYYSPSGLMTLQILNYYKNDKITRFHIWGYDEESRTQDVCTEGIGIGVLDELIEMIESYKTDLQTMVKDNRTDEIAMQKRIISKYCNELAKNYILWNKYEAALSVCNESINYDANDENYYTKYQILMKLNKSEEADRALLQARIFNKNI